MDLILDAVAYWETTLQVRNTTGPIKLLRYVKDFAFCMKHSSTLCTFPPSLSFIGKQYLNTFMV